MIRTNVVKLTRVPAVAYRQKLGSEDIGVIILKPGVSQPGMASISKKTGEPVLAKNTPVREYPIELFKEAMELTYGMPFRRQGSVKVTKDMFVEPVEETEQEVEEVVIDSNEYQKLADRYTDKTGKLSYDLLNKDFIQFAHRSSIVRKMIADKKSEKEIVNYITANKIRNITGNDDLTESQVEKIIDLLDEVSPKGVFKQLKDDVRKQLGKKK